MTEQELSVIDLTAQTWNAFMKLPVMHNDDVHDFRHHIHALQNIILAREGSRTLKMIEKENTEDLIIQQLYGWQQ